MKTSCFIFALLASTLAEVQAQVIGTSATTVATQPVLPAPTAYGVVTNDANSRVWERTVYEQGPNGTVVPRKHQYTELASGLNYRDPQTGQWLPSKEEIDILPNGGAAATRGAHQVYFPGDIAQGVIRLVTPDGLQLQSRPVGLFFEDDDNSALIAILTNSVGGLVGSNEVVYPDAFEGAAASLHYKYTRGGFEQDVVVQGQLPDPAELGLNPARTRLGVLTAFVDNNNPVATTEPTDPADGLSDSTLAFGGMMKMGHGQAFSIGNTGQAQLPAGGNSAAWLNWATNAAQQSSGGTSTYKRWFQLNGHNFLMEEVPYHRVAAQLQQLPAATGGAGIIATNLFAANSILNGISAEPLASAQSSKSEIVNRKSAMIRLSRAGWDQTRALVLDYVTVDSGGDYTFQGDTTYYVSGLCDFNNVTLEGGTVIKYENVNNVYTTDIGRNYANAFIEVDGTLTCNTSSYRPAIFTAVDDDTVGVTMPYSTGNPAGNQYANPAIYAGYSAVINLSNVRINYAQKAVWVGDSGHITLSDSQVNECQILGVLGLNASDHMSLTCNNCLYNGSYYGILVLDYGVGGNSYNFTNCTFNNIYILAYAYNYNYYPNYCNAVNSIFANSSLYDRDSLTLQGSYNGFYSTSPTFGSPATNSSSSPFRTVGAGSFYLATNTFRGFGTANISSNLLADLRTKSTYPPVVYSNITFSIATNFSPQARRDTNSSPDLGYHYDPMDYFFGGVTANSNVTFTAGTAAGWFELPGSGGPGYGIALNKGIVATFNGTATSPCVFARYDAVHEGGNGLWQDKGWLGGVVNGGSYDTNNPAGITATFTHFLHLANDPNLFRDGTSGQPIVIQAKHCELYGSAGGYNMLAGYTNCLFYRAGFGIGTASAYPYQKYINCTFYGGTLYFGHWEGSAPYWYSYIHNCAFDNTTNSIGDPFGSNTNYADYNYNAFNLGAAQPPTEGANTVVVTNGFNWQSSWFGNYYLPPDSLLIDASDRTADLIGLFHFTTQTNQTIEGFSTVDIGYHYVATDQYGNPLDSNSDGIPDYIEDANGNGLIDNGETAWTYDTNLEGLTTTQEQLYGANPNVSLGFGIWLAEPLLFGIP